MKNKALDFIKRPFIRNIFILASGTAMAQIINMIFSPLITRIYGPEAYGLMGSFNAIIQIVAPIAALSYPIGIVLPKEKEEAETLTKLSFYITIANTLAITLILFLIDDYIVTLFNLNTISEFLYLIPIVVFSAGCMQIIQQWLVRENLFRISAKAYLTETLLVNLGNLIGGLFNPIATTLILFTAFKQGIRTVFMVFFSNTMEIKKVFSINDLNINTLKKVGKKYKDFPLYRTPEVALSAISTSIPILLLTSFSGPATAGFYSIAKTVLEVPSSLIAQSVGDVFYPKVAKTAQYKQKVAPLLLRSTFYLGLTGIIPYGFIIIFGPWLFELVFGAEWFVAGEYARWVSLWSYFNFINKPSIKTLPVISAQKFQFYFTLSKLFITSGSLIFGFVIFKSDLIAIALFGISGGISYLILIIITYRKSLKYDTLNS